MLIFIPVRDAARRAHVNQALCAHTKIVFPLLVEEGRIDYRASRGINEARHARNRSQVSSVLDSVYFEWRFFTKITTFK